MDTMYNLPTSFAFTAWVFAVGFVLRAGMVFFDDFKNALRDLKRRRKP